MNEEHLKEYLDILRNFILIKRGNYQKNYLYGIDRLFNEDAY